MKIDRMIYVWQKHSLTHLKDSTVTFHDRVPLNCIVRFQNTFHRMNNKRVESSAWKTKESPCCTFSVERKRGFPLKRDVEGNRQGQNTVSLGITNDIDFVGSSRRSINPACTLKNSVRQAGR